MARLATKPLTEKGKEQARALGRNLQGTRFWRTYSSDLSRARETTQWILRSAAAETHNVENIRLDERLRELARGPRQGFPKDWTQERALEERERLGMERVVLLETPETGWDRFFDFWKQIIVEASVASDNDGYRNDEGQGQLVRNVLVVSHSGILRIFLQRLLGQRLEEHASARFDDRFGHQFLVPNTSLTILELEQPRQADSVIDETQDALRVDESNTHIVIRRLTDTTHYENMVAPSNSETSEARR